MRRLWIAALSAALSWITPQAWGQPGPGISSQTRHPAPEQVVVMSLNLYLGPIRAPMIGAILSGCPAAITRQVTKTWRNIHETDFRERADAIARAIIAHQPDLIGLQEAMLFRTGLPDSLQGNATRAGQVELDFVEILLHKLDSGGVPYTLVAITEQTDIELPGYAWPPRSCCRTVLRDIRLTDRVAILIRTELLASGIQISNVQGARFADKIDLPIGLSGCVLPIYFGWNSVDVAWRGHAFRFVNTCLELALTPRLRRVQMSQAAELLNGPVCTSLPVIVVGDSNSPADRPHAPAYSLLLSAGLHDAWTHTHPCEPGYTFGNRPLLRNPVPMTYHPSRFDLILYRGPFQATCMARMGVDPTARTVTGMWPSDHAGVVATLRLTTPAPPAVAR